jgi:hypothetical protein
VRGTLGISYHDLRKFLSPSKYHGARTLRIRPPGGDNERWLAYFDSSIAVVGRSRQSLTYLHLQQISRRFTDLVPTIRTYCSQFMPSVQWVFSGSATLHILSGFQAIESRIPAYSSFASCFTYSSFA